MVNFFKTNLTSETCGIITQCAEFFNQIPGVIVIQDASDATIAFMNDIGIQKTGLSSKEMNALSLDDYHSRFFLPDDVSRCQKIIQEFLNGNSDETFSLYQQIRYPSDSIWRWHLSNVKVFLRDELGKPLLTLCMYLPLDGISDTPLHVKRLLDDHDFLVQNQKLFSKLSKREIAILKQVALGKTSVEIGDLLFIAPTTVDTHRRNIRRKLKTRSFFEIAHYAKTFKLI